MDINTINGTFNKFISLDFIDATDNNVPSYASFGAIYYDKLDYRDYQPYFYSAFLKDDEMFMLRVRDSGNELSVDWNWRFVEYTAAEVAVEKLLNEKEPTFIVPDPK